MNAQVELAGKVRVAKDWRSVCNSGALGIGLHRCGVRWTPVSVCSSAGAFSRIPRWTQQESDARSLKFQHGVTLVWREPIVGAPRAGTEWQPCQRLWRPSFHLPGPPPPPALPEIHLGPCCTCPKERHPSLPLIEVFSQSITCGDAIKAS